MKRILAVMACMLFAVQAVAEPAAKPKPRKLYRGTYYLDARGSDDAAQNNLIRDQGPRYAEFAANEGDELIFRDASAPHPTTALWTPVLGEDAHYPMMAWPWDEEVAASYLRRVARLGISADHDPECIEIPYQNGVFRNQLRVRLHPPLQGLGTATLPASAGPEVYSEFRRIFPYTPPPNEARVKNEKLTPRHDWNITFDFHTYIEKDGSLTIIPRIHSPMLDAKSIFENAPDVCINGPFEAHTRLFQEATREIAGVFERILREQELGGGYRFTEEASFEKSYVASIPTGRSEGANLWTLDSETTSGTLLFRMPRPLDSYRGSATRMEASLESVKGAEKSVHQFRVSIPTSGLTMGEEGIDETLRYAVESETFPLATFEAEVPSHALRSGHGSRISSTGLVSGRFKLAGMEIPVTVRGDVVFLENADGASRLRLTGIFQIRLQHPFKILGPVGEAPINDTVFFYMRIYMKPSDELNREK